MTSLKYDSKQQITRSAAAKRVYRTTQTLKSWEISKGLRPTRINSRVFVYDRLEFEKIAQEVAPAQFLIIR